MTALLHPGVYVQEVPSGIRSIEGVPTSTALVVGETERGPLEPTKIRSAADYGRLFGGHLRHAGGSDPSRVTTRYAVDLFFQNGGSSVYVLRASLNTARATRADLFEAVSPGEWGSHLFALFAHAGSGTYPGVDGAPATARFRVVIYYEAPGGEPELVEDWDRVTIDATDANYVVNVLQRSLYVRWGTAAAPPAAPDVAPAVDPTALDAAGVAPGALAGGGSNATLADADLDDVLARADGIDDAALLVGASERWVGTTPFADDAAIGDYFDTLRTYVDARPKQDLFLVGDLPSFGTQNDPAGAARSFADTGITRSDFAAVYWPHILVADPVGPTLGATLQVPPSGAVAGLYARTDARRGVWKAPAGVEATVGGIVRLQRDTLDGEQDDLNPAGVNVVRLIPGAGSVVWGARTLRPGSEWRYVPVRRTAMFLRKSIYNGIQFAVFEPNDTGLWSTLRATIGAFMETQFRNGAFAGSTSREAYFVKVDSETTTEIDQAAGIVNVLVGFAPLRPAEFVVVRLSQKTVSAS